MEGVKYPIKIKQKGFKGTAVYDYRSARTEVNPKWRWWKPWIERFLCFPAGYYLWFEICGTLDLDNMPDWHYSGDVETDIKRPDVLSSLRN